MQRWFIYSGNFNEVDTIRTDVAIIGCGAAGLYTALNLDPKLNCILFNKLGPLICNSMYAQGGIAAVTGQSPQDNTDKHFHDTLLAGAGLCDEKAVRVLVDEAAGCMQSLIDMGVPFDRKDGLLSLTREGGHSENRILHCGGDATGLHLTERLYALSDLKPNIRHLHNTMLTDILMGEYGVNGILVMDEKGKPLHIECRCVVLASGGIGRVYRNSTNAACTTGDGIAAAMRAGVETEDMEFVQFHPTAFLHPDDNGRFFLISEALRGEGAVLKNRNGEAFMQNAHPLKDLAPRDIVSRAIIAEMARKNLHHVYLDITARSRSYLMQRFPTIYGECMRRGIDIAKNWIPVIPVQHYFMGGIKTDLNARTNIKGLYACGEAARTGVHGANRLASNSLLECLVFGKRCAQDINGSERPKGKPSHTKADFKAWATEYDLDSFVTEMRELMTRKCGILRNEQGLQEAALRIGSIKEVLDNAALPDKKSLETYNIASAALSILHAARARKHSAGAHYRDDEK